MRSPDADVDEAKPSEEETKVGGQTKLETKPTGWLTDEEKKGLYEADVEAATEAWKEEGEEAPSSEEATRLLVGCAAIAS